MESGTGSRVRAICLKETHSHNPQSNKSDYFSVPLHLISGPDPDQNATFLFSIYPQRRLPFLPHPRSCPSCSFCVFGRTSHKNLSLCSAVTGDFDQHPGCLHKGQFCFPIPCCHFENKRCVGFKHKN